LRRNGFFNSPTLSAGTLPVISIPDRKSF